MVDPPPPRNDLEFPELTPALRDRSPWGMLGFFGPGAIIACVTIGSGETVFASRGGAIYGYAMLWCFVAGALCKGVQIYSASRFITLTGRGPLQSWMDLPGPRGWFVWFVAVMTVLFMPLWLSGLPQMLGEFSNWVVGYPAPDDVEQYKLAGRWWGTFYIVVAITITWLQTYGFLEKVQTAIIALLLFCMTIAALVSHPDWAQLVSGLLLPTLPDYAAWVPRAAPELRLRSPWVEVVAYVGVIGGGSQDYFGYIGMLREKGWGMLGRSDTAKLDQAPRIATNAENLARGRRWLLAPQIDVTVSGAAVLIFTVCFVTLGATVLHPQQIIPSKFSLLTVQAEFLVPLAGTSAVLQWMVAWMYKTGIFFALFGTILGAYEIYTRTIHEMILALVPRWKDVPLRKVRMATLLYSGGGGLVLLWTLDIDPVELLTPAILVSSGLICGLWCFAMLWSDRVHLPRALRMPKSLKLALVVAGLVLTVAPLIGIVEFINDILKEVPDVTTR